MLPFCFLSRVPHSTAGLIHANQIAACPQQQITVWDWLNMTTTGGRASPLLKELMLMVFQNDAPEELTIKERLRRRGERQMFSGAWKTVVYNKPCKHLKSHKTKSQLSHHDVNTSPFFCSPKVYHRASVPLFINCHNRLSWLYCVMDREKKKRGEMRTGSASGTAQTSYLWLEMLLLLVSR